MKSSVVFLITGLLAASLSLSASVDTQHSHPANPGTLNYVEGQASIGNQPVTSSSVGSVELEEGQSLTTQAGKVEILLTPGVFLRVADNTSVKMISPNLANTKVQLDKGRAMVEVLEIRKENDIQIGQNDATTKLLKKGLYDFDADHQQIRVLKGAVEVYVKDQNIKVNDRRALALSDQGKLNARNYDTLRYEDEFFRWNALRSGYLSEAGIDEAREYVGAGPGWYGPGWYGPGWYWNPWWSVWTFLPADGIYYSPFGWGFYSPIVVYHSPFWFYGWGHNPHPFGEFHRPYGHGFEPSGGFHGGGFRGGMPGGGRR